MCKSCSLNVDDFWLDRIRHDDVISPESAKACWFKTGFSTPDKTNRPSTLSKATTRLQRIEASLALRHA